MSVAGMAHSGHQRDWLSVYLYPAGAIEPLLADVGAVVGQWTAATRPEALWFFIRYGDRQGPHVRLRFNCANASKRQAALDLLARRFGVQGLAASRRSGVVATGTVRRARLVRYRPEIGRYGGRARIALSERFFHDSSRWVLQYGNLLGTDYSKRLLMSGLCAYFLLRVGGSEAAETAKLAGGMAAAWIRTLQERKTHAGKAAEIMEERWTQDHAAWCRSFTLAAKYLASPEDEPSPLHTWVADCRARMAELDRSFRQRNDPKRVRILQSWVHMHLNRMGLSNSDEALIIYCLSRYFETGGRMA